MTTPPKPPTKLTYTAATMDRLIGKVSNHRANLMAAGHIDHFGHPVSMQPAGVPAAEPVTHGGHCMKCQTKVDALTESVEDHPNGAKRAVGSCPTCRTKVHRFMSAADGQKLKEQLAATGGVPLQ